ncbi:MAG TPA: hypothetical protein VM076_10085 [Gemmatimonadaceae bacterium]|nr:hypothetical protein [Gemmatimonadaceae bacterium]
MSPHRTTRAVAVTVVVALMAATLPALVGAQATQTQVPSRPTFPNGWAGVWEGTLTTWSAPDSVRSKIPVKLTIAREDTGSAYTWRTLFNADTVRGVRPYRLVVRDAGRGSYGTDEGNGLLLEETWIAGTLISVFQVGSRVLESRYALRGDTLTHDIVWWSATPMPPMKGTGPNAERGAAVSSFRVEGRQRAEMTRKR